MEHLAKLGMTAIPFLVLTVPAMAGIVYTDIPDTTTSLFGSESQTLDLNGDGITDFTIAPIDGIVQLVGSPGAGVHADVSSQSWIFSLPLGTAIDGNLSYLASGGFVDAGFETSNKDGEVGYVGVSFTLDDENLYGWIGIQKIICNGCDFAIDPLPYVTVVGFAYQSDPSGTITAGQIPGPAGIAMLAAGAACLAGRPRRKL